MINVQVIYALAENPTIIDYQLADDSTVLQAINATNILTLCHLSLSSHKVGIYGKLVNLTDLLQDGDRIEIYRPLINDPKEIRRRRANAKAK